MENKGLHRSLVLHVILVVLAVFGLPQLFHKPEPEPVNIVTVELIPITSITNVPKAEEPEKPQEEMPKKEEPKFEKKAPPPPPPKQEEATPEPEKKPAPEEAEPLPEATAKPVPKPKAVPPKKTEEKPKKKDTPLDFESVLKTVEKIEKKQAATEKKEAKEAATAQAKSKTNTRFDSNASLSISERDAIIQQISQCWSIPSGAKDAQSLSVLLHLSLEKDGTVREVTIVDTMRYDSGDTFYRAAADSAMRAVLKCSPLKKLPPEKYETWREIEMNFDPSEMLY